MVSLQTKDLKLSLKKHYLSYCHLSFKSHVEGGPFPLIYYSKRKKTLKSRHQLSIFGVNPIVLEHDTSQGGIEAFLKLPNSR